ncbi:MAG: homoserine dehydrogenase [Arenicella sp.]|jgi:homoserine dehydrogenase
MKPKKLQIGLFGFGCVGQGLHDVLGNSTNLIADIERIAVKNRDKKRSLPAENFTFDKEDILQNDKVNLVVELIDDADEAYKIVKKSLQNGKSVVSANKKMVAEHLEEFVDLQKENEVSLLYEASCCGSIPIIRTLEEYYDNELLFSISGIFNGSSNYILTKVLNEGKAYEDVLKQAQELGFAETDPILDVGGFDAKYKLVILTAHSFGIFVKPEGIFNFGIQNLSPFDARFAKEKEWKIKLIAQAYKLSHDSKEVAIYVVPQFVTEENYLYNVENEYNGVVVEAAFSEKQFFRGKGAGGHPTGSAVLSDISANRYGYGYEYRKAKSKNGTVYTDDVNINVYFRFNELDSFDKLDFISISEKYEGTEGNYVIGEINLQTLKTSEQFKRDDVFLVELPK